MPVLGAVLNLADEGVLRQAALCFLERHSAVTLGELQARGLPVVIECATRAEERAFWEELEAQPGVLFSSVVYADFSDLVFEGEA